MPGETSGFRTGDAGSHTGTDAAVPTGVPVGALAYGVVDAVYSRAIDRVVIVSQSGGNAMHLVDPSTSDDVTITLPAVPASVSVSPDGSHAAVGHDGFISYVDLKGHTVVNTWNVSANFGAVALDAHYVYGFPLVDQWVPLYTVDVSTGVVTTSNNIYAGMQGAVSPDGKTLFGADVDLDPESLYAFDLSDPAQPVQGPMNFGDTYSPCGQLWLSKDSSRVYTGCGNVYNASDLSYFGALTSANQFVAGVDDWSADGTVAALGGMAASVDDDEYGQVGGGAALQVYEPQFLGLKRTVPLPPISTPGGETASDGRFVFHDAAGTSMVVILHGNDPASSVDVYAVAELQ